MTGWANLSKLIYAKVVYNGIVSLIFKANKHNYAHIFVMVVILNLILLLHMANHIYDFNANSCIHPMYHYIFLPPGTPSQVGD